MTTRWLWSVHGAWIHGGSSIGSLDSFGFSRSFDTATVAPSGDTCVFTLNPRSSALLATNRRRKSQDVLFEFAYKITLRVKRKDTSFLLYLRRVFCINDAYINQSRSYVL